MQDDQFFAFLAVRNSRDEESGLGGAGEFVQFLLDFDVRDHFAADFAEAREAVGDGEEAVFVDGSDVAGDVPAVAKDFTGLVGPAQIALHDIRPADEKKARSVGAEGGASFGVFDADADSRKRMADFAAFAANLAEAGGAIVVGVDSDGGGTFRAAVSFKRADAEAVFKSQSDALGQFFRADEDELQAAEILGLAAANIGLEESGRGEEKSDFVFADQLADGGHVERAVMIDNADAEDGGEPERDREAERVEKRQDAEEAIGWIEHERLAHLVDVGGDVEMRKHHAFGIAGAATGENHGGQIVEFCDAAARETAHEPAARKPPEEQGSEFFREARMSGDVFEQNGFQRKVELQAVEEKLCGDDRLKPALRGAGDK